MTDTMLAARSLHKRFGDACVLNDIHLNVGRGEFLAIMGPSGSGKSTLLYCLSSMDRPTEGSVRFLDTDLQGQSDEVISDIRLRKMGFVFQHSHLLKSLSVRDNIALPGLKATRMSRAQVVARTDALMERMGIGHVAGHDIKTVSGGQLQRAAICRALVNEPDVVFGDEPTGALNSTASREVMDILNALNREGKTVIVVTHDPKVAARADRVIYLTDGTIRDACRLGRYQPSQEGREAELHAWLESLGF